MQEGKVARKLDPGFERGFQGSWSGYERDKLFWNPDGNFPRFFDASYIQGLDFDDDGRASIPVDIDGDGDLDLAMLSLQQLHLMLNTSRERHFSRVRLQATRSHPLALGAIVKLSAGGVVRQDYVRITDGFLSQVPADLHFGLGDTASIDWIEVSWPSGGTPQRIEGPAVDGLVTIVEGQPAATFAVLPAWPKGSIPASAPSASPNVELAGLDGSRGPVAAPGLPSVINFWAPDCAACVEEIPALSETYLKWKGRASFAGVSAEFRDLAAVRAALDRLAPAYPQFVADEAVLGRFFGNDGAVAMPSTLIFDKQGRLCRVFRRAVSVADVEEVLVSLQKEGEYWADLQLRGQDALIRGDFARARALFEKAVAIRPDLASLWTDLGIAWLGLKDELQAESSFSQAVRADPGHPKALENYGTSLFKRGRTREALEAFRIAARTLPDDVGLLVNLGNAAAASGEMAEALKAFERAVGLDDESAEAWMGKGKVLASTSDTAGARAALQEALKRKPSLEEARGLLNRLPR